MRDLCVPLRVCPKCCQCHHPALAQPGPGAATSAQKEHLILFICQTAIGYLQYARTCTASGGWPETNTPSGTSPLLVPTTSMAHREHQLSSVAVIRHQDTKQLQKDGFIWTIALEGSLSSRSSKKQTARTGRVAGAGSSKISWKLCYKIKRPLTCKSHSSKDR